MINQLARGFHRHGGIHHQQVGNGRHEHHRRKITLQVITEFGIKTHIYRVRQYRFQQGVAIGRGMGRHFRRDIGGATGTIVDHHLLSPCFADFLPHGARQRIRAAAGREGHDKTYWAYGVCIGGMRDGGSGCLQQHDHRNDKSLFLHAGFLAEWLIYYKASSFGPIAA